MISVSAIFSELNCPLTGQKGGPLSLVRVSFAGDPTSLVRNNIVIRCSLCYPSFSCILCYGLYNAADYFCSFLMVPMRGVDVGNILMLFLNATDPTNCIC